MTHTPAPAEIETLRKIVAGRTCTEHDQRAAVAILDRLSPPLPEQPDEATKIWREQRSALLDLLAIIHRDGGHKTQEIGWKLASEQAMQLSSERIAAESELAALRAENERLKKLDHEYGQVETAIIMADPEFDGDSDHATCGERLIASVKRLARKAAERKPAEPDEKHETAFSISKRKYEEKIADTAPVVEVTQADLEIANAIISGFRKTSGCYYADAKGTTHWLTKEVLRIRTEAETRGRREALDEALNVVSDYADGFRAAYYIDPIIDELKRLMTEGK